ncbi:hypothetical protein [Microbacterium sp. SORGH_AS_0888]|uniref:hypothetical protein n=1 Tax=Microbacterium sp. SORGH_AS_0888 TaxID=3041791 RepID=UPI00278106D6|nr:hypothetical protein [Microbacterium sp. SORGH_AS_0888]MDQ1127957.1 hypothetical protein [Microbacterium sp. SORGH_AS_0888]
MRLRTTSPERTYRYLRLGIVGVVLLLGVSLAVQSMTGGPLGSVSAAYYTPARDVFVGCLCAVSLALLALSGRSVEQALLDLAALFAPVIAFVPTPIAPGDVAAVGCAATTAPCVPAAAQGGIDNAMLSLAVLGAIGLAGALALAIAQGTLSWRLGLALTVAGLVMAGFVLWWRLWPRGFVTGAHDVATIAFFALIAAVAVVAALRPVNARHPAAVRAAYLVIAGGIVLSLVFLVTVAIVRRSTASGGIPLFFVGEAVALALFAAFWLVQTAELWERPDPALTRRRGPRRRLPATPLRHPGP